MIRKELHNANRRWVAKMIFFYNYKLEVWQKPDGWFELAMNDAQIHWGRLVKFDGVGRLTV